MRHIFFLILLTLFISGSSAQNFIEVTGNKLTGTIEKISVTSSKIETLECNFIEEKAITVLAEKSISTGKMYYSKRDKIRWEYITPNPFMFIVNGSETVVKNGERVERGNSASAKIFGEVGKIILSSINGETIVDEKKFSAKYLSNGSEFKIVMTPRDKRMKQLMTEIVFTFSLSDQYIEKIEMKNQSGDLTTISLQNKKINKPIAPVLFKL